MEISTKQKGENIAAGTGNDFRPSGRHHIVHIYHSVYPLFGIGTHPHPPPQASELASPRNLKGAPIRKTGEKALYSVYSLLATQEGKTKRSSRSAGTALGQIDKRNNYENISLPAKQSGLLNVKARA